MKASGKKTIAQNKKAYHDYFIEETFEAGIVLSGTEVKSLRQGRVNLKDSHAAVHRGELFLYGMHISPTSRATSIIRTLCAPASCSCISGK